MSQYTAPNPAVNEFLSAKDAAPAGLSHRAS
jgi:hypothetical protein